MIETINMPVSPGELIDRITILELKQKHLQERLVRERVERELHALWTIREQQLPSDPIVMRLTEELRTVNRELWGVEDALRDCERRSVFGDAFIALARSVYRHNDRRAALKRAINEQYGSGWHDEKAYAPY